MEELMSAAEKRKKYESASDAQSQAELKRITGLINNANGLSIYLSPAPSKPVEAILRRKGYKCGWEQTGINESDYMVSW